MSSSLTQGVNMCLFSRLIKPPFLVDQLLHIINNLSQATDWHCKQQEDG